MFQYFLGRYPKTLLYTDNPKNRFKPISDLGGNSGITLVPSYGSTVFSCINNLPNAGDIQYGYATLTPSYLMTANFGLETFPEAVNWANHQIKVRIRAEANQEGLVFYGLDASVGSAVLNTPIVEPVTDYELNMNSYNPTADHKIKLSILSPPDLTIQVKIHTIDVIVVPRVNMSSGFFLQLCGP